MKQKFIDYFMDVAERTSQLSHAVRLKVGSIIVKDGRIISIGYNGMPSGWDNKCEDETYEEDGFHIKLTTKPEVLHAETNAITKLARNTESGIDSIMFCTHAPCLDCAKLIYQSGIQSLYYRDSYRNDNGLKFLEKSNVNVIQYRIQN